MEEPQEERESWKRNKSIHPFCAMDHWCTLPEVFPVALREFVVRDMQGHHCRVIHVTKGRELKAIMQICAPWKLLDPRQAPVPGDGSDPIPDLPIHPGYKCKKCDYMTVSRKKITTHRKQVHQSIDKIWEEVYLQMFMNGRYSKYWVVRT